MDPFADVKAIARLMDDFPHPWAFCGGWAIDLYLGRPTRTHPDVDVMIFRRDQLALQAFLLERGWRLEKAHQGKLFPWAQREFIELPVHTIWCKNEEYQPDFFEVLFNEADGARFRYRRAPAITLELLRAIHKTEEGLPFLAPEIVLLYKSNNPTHAGNAADFENAHPSLASVSRTWLGKALGRLESGHPWLEALDACSQSP